MRNSERVVRKRLADGSVKTYRYAGKPRAPRFDDDSLGALILAYKASQEWLGLAERTRTTYAIYLRVLEAAPHTLVRSVTRRDILALRDAVATGRGVGASTGFLRAASALFGWAVDREWIDHTPMTRVKALPGGSLPAWTDAHVAAALADLSEPLRRAVVLALHTGQRRGDLCALRWDAIDGEVLRFRQEKTGADMALAIPPGLRAELDEWRREAVTLTILDNGSGRPWNAQRLSEMMRRALIRIGLPGLGIHGVRKHVSARLANHGATTHEIAAVTGHRTLSMVEHYTRSADQERLAGSAVARLSQRPRKSS